MTHDEIVSKCTAKYNNLVDQKAWTNSNSRNAKLVALATQVESLEKKLSEAKNGNNNNNGSQSNRQEG